MILQDIRSKRSEIRRLVDKVWRFLQCFTLIDDNEYSEESFNREEGIRS